MSLNQQLSQENTNDPVDSTYFKLGLKYLISGVHRCLTQMQHYYHGSDENHDHLSSLTKELTEKINIFSSPHLNSDTQVAKNEDTTTDSLWRSRRTQSRERASKKGFNESFDCCEKEGQKAQKIQFEAEENGQESHGQSEASQVLSGEDDSVD